MRLVWLGMDCQGPGLAWNCLPGVWTGLVWFARCLAWPTSGLAWPARGLAWKGLPVMWPGLVSKGSALV